MDSSSIAFWGTLGGMSLVCIFTVAIVYFMCFSRNRSFCMSTESEDLLETTVHHEEVHTVTSESRTSAGSNEEPKVVHRTKQVHTITTKQRSRGSLIPPRTSQPVTKIRVSPRSESSHKQPSTSKNERAFNETSFAETLTTPRPGQSQVTSIGTSS